MIKTSNLKSVVNLLKNCSCLNWNKVKEQEAIQSNLLSSLKPCCKRVSLSVKNYILTAKTKGNPKITQ